MAEEKNNNLDAELEHELDALETWDGSSEKEEKKAVSWDDKKDTLVSEKLAEDADPFARLATKKVAKPKSMQDIMQKKVKKGRKVSPKFFLIGCGLFFLLFLWLMFGGLYYAINSAGVLESIGLEMEDVKNILLIFAVLFFGLIFFLGFYVLVLNIYRLVTVKGKKVKYIFGLLLGLFVLVGTIIWGTLSINKIRSLAWTQVIQSTNLVLTYVETREGNVFAEDGIPLIAPLNMNFVLNKWSNADIIKQVVQSIDRQSPYPVELDCGNGQILPMVGNGIFAGKCLFLEKQPYEFILRVTLPEWVEEYPAAGFTPQAVVDIEAIDDTSYLNDKKTEYIIGIAPVNVRFRGQKLFTDLGLSNDSIERDLDGDKRIDTKDNATFEYPYTDSQLHTISYRLPELSGWGSTWFTFDLRVVESELARCSLAITEMDAQQRTYRFTPKFDELVQAQSYHYTIYETVQGDIIEKLKESGETTTFSFPKGGVYTVSASYFTTNGQKGSCESEQVEVGFNGNQVAFDLKWKQAENEPFTAIGEGTPVTLDDESARVTVTTLPAILEFAVTDIQPDPTAELTVLYNERQIFPDHDDVYEVAITSLGEKEFTFQLETKQGEVTEQPYIIDVSRSTVRANLKIEPDTVGEDPFTVTLDASISDLYIQDQDDEIVFFTWDFGDGESRENISQGKVNHTYRFDEEADSGEYYPSVTVKTKLGFEDTYRVQTPISVKRKQKEVAVRVESHPTQQVKAGELVTFALDTDGIVTHIDWNFGNQKAFGCDDRSCASTTMRYLEAGEYEIKTEVQYESDTPVVGRVKIKVYE